MMSYTTRSRVATMSSTEVTINGRSSLPLSSPLPKLITYDVFEEKSPQHLLFEAAKARKEFLHRWETFADTLKNYMSWEKLSKKMVKNLDDKKQWAPLHYAVFHHNTFVCDKLTAKKSDEKHFQCDINILTGNGENVLHIAARSNCIWTNSSSSNTNQNAVTLPEIITHLVDRGANIHHADDENRTPLHIAVMENRLTFVQYLLHKGANVYAITKLHANVLHLTFIPGRQTSAELTDMFKLLISQLSESTGSYSQVQKSRNLARMYNLDNRTPLVLAICHPSITEDIVQKLIFLIEIHSQYTTIDLLTRPSSEEKNALQIQFLMAIGQISRRSFTNYQHLSPIIKSETCDFQTRQQLLHFPCHYDNDLLLKWLLEQPLPKDASTKSKDEASMLEGRDHAGYTPLLTAVFYRSRKCVEYLLQNPTPNVETNGLVYYKVADIKATNHDGENVLHICAKHHVSESVSELIWQLAVNQGLLEMLDDDGNSPLHVAASNNQTSFCEAVLSLKESSNKFFFNPNSYGQTAAHVATEAMPHRIGPERHHVGKHIPVPSKPSNPKTNTDDHDNDDDDKHDFGLPFLRQIWHKAEKGDKNNCLFKLDFDRQTCLHLAAAHGQIKIVKFLVEEVGIEIDCIAERRLTPLHLACQYGYGKIVAYLIEHGASPTFRSAELYNCLEIAIMNQNENVVKDLLTLPNWRQLMRNAQKIPHTEAYDTPMRKLIRYMPEVTIWMIDRNLTRRLGGQGKHVFKTVYDYEFYVDIYLVRKWYTQGADIDVEKETCRERCDRRASGALCLCTCCCCPTKTNGRTTEMLAYTDDAYTLVHNHPLFIAGHQSQCPNLIEHPYNKYLRDHWFKQYGFYFVRVISFLLYAGFLGIFTAIILSGKHPQYFYAKTNRNMTLDPTTCAIVSNTLTAANDPEALKTTSYRILKVAIYPLLILFVIKNMIPIIALFPKIFRSLEYHLEISALVLCYVYILDWYDWQEPLIFRCPIQYQLGAMGLLLGYINMLTYIRRIPFLQIGIFVTMLQLISVKFLRFIPVLMIVICGFGFTHWMLLQNQEVFQTPIAALIRTGLLTFDLGYEDHFYKDTYYYMLIIVVTILSAIVFCIFILNLLISLAVGEIPSLTEQGTIWRSEMLYSLLSDYSITALQCIRLLNCISCGRFQQWITNKLIKGGKRLQPIVIIERDETGGWRGKFLKCLQNHIFDEKIQDDIKLSKNSSDAKKEGN